MIVWIKDGGILVQVFVEGVVVQGIGFTSTTSSSMDFDTFLIGLLKWEMGFLG